MNWSAVMARLRAGGWITALGVLLLAVAGMLHGVFVPGQTLFSNDGPLGELMAQCHRLPERFTGCWLDLNCVGFNGGAAAPNLSFGLQWLLGPVWFSKLYALLALLILGLGAWCFFRQSKLSPLACLLGGLAVVLNSTFFSVACWGVGAHDLTGGMFFFALAALADTASPQRWLRVLLAGMAVGLAVSDGADIGAIFSLYVVAFVVYQIWTVEGSRVKSLAAGAGRLLLVGLCAAFLAAESLHGLASTYIHGMTVKGETVAEQETQATTGHRWDWATQWSLPKVETLNLVVPGLFGYRSSTPNGGTYWGRMGRDPAWDAYFKNGSQGPAPTSFFRFTGGGNYAGGLVVLVALWAAAQSLRRSNSVFDPAQRKWLWFWLVLAVVSLLLAFGRFAPFYQLVYALPYFSTIRNPTKFLYPFVTALVVLFAFGVDGMCRRYLQPAAAGVPARWPGLQSWWRRAGKFDRRWVLGCGVVWLASLLAWWAYAAHREELVEYLQGARINQSPALVADFSIHQVGWFVVVFGLAAGLQVLIFSGAFAGSRAIRGGLGLAILLVADLGLANQPWITYWNYVDKYASNPVLDLLRDKPYEHRVANTPPSRDPALANLAKVYKREWMQQQFPYYNIQAFEMVEMSRIPEDFSTFLKAVNDTNKVGTYFHLVRAWQLTATRYVLAPTDFPVYLTEQPYLAEARFQTVAQFSLEPKPGFLEAKRPDQTTAVISDTGDFGLFDFTEALPRAKLFSRWQSGVKDDAALESLFDPAFDPRQTVFVADDVPVSPSTETNLPPGSVEIVHYAPKDIALQAEASAPSVLLLNDHFDPDWKVFVDGRPATLLRCNFLMRGVQLAAGAHHVEFKFQPPYGWLWVSLAALGTTVLALVVLAVWTGKNRAMAAAPAVATTAVLAAMPTAVIQAPPRDSRKAARRSREGKR